MTCCGLLSGAVLPADHGAGGETVQCEGAGGVAAGGEQEPGESVSHLYDRAHVFRLLVCLLAA